MPVGNVTGLSSGIDWGETIDLLMQLEHRPVDILEVRRSSYQTKLTNWNAIESKITSLENAAEGLDTMDEFLAKSGTSADTDVLTVTAGADAIAGSHEVIVNQLAANHVHAHKPGWADLNSTPVNNSAGDQYLSYDYGGTAVTVTVPDGTTLQGLVNLINRDPDNAGVTASVINDGTGGGTDYHLVLSGNDTGEDYDIQIIDAGPNPTDLGDGSQWDEANWDATQDAQNAEIRVDGFPDPAWGWPNPWIESETNDIEDVIPGVTFHLKDDSGGSSVQIEVSLDKAAITAQVNSLITAFNNVIDTINTATHYDAEEEAAGPLSSDSLARSIRSELLSFVAASIPGTDDDDVYRSLGQVGITITSDGNLTLDEEELEEALDDDPAGVARLFVFDSRSSSSYVSVTGHSEETVGGTHNWTVTYDADGHLNPSGTNTLGGYDAIIHGDSIFSGAEDTDVEGLLMLLTDPGDGPDSLSGTVKVYTGLSVLLDNYSTRLTDPIDGSLKSTRDGINDSIDLLDDRIENWERRLSNVEETYQRRFTNMELLIGQLQNTSAFLSAL